MKSVIQTSLVALILASVSSVIVVSLKIINLDSPASAFVGDSIKLSCLYTTEVDSSSSSSSSSSLMRGPGTTSRVSTSQGEVLENQLEADGAEQLYAIKWYKDEMEFFRFLGRELPRKTALPVPGIQVDLDQSDNRTVSLRDVSLKTAGLFKCEVSLDAPQFLTKSMEKRLDIFHIPTTGPVIEITNHSYGCQPQDMPSGLGPNPCFNSRRDPQQQQQQQQLEPGRRNNKLPQTGSSGLSSLVLYNFTPGDLVQFQCRAPDSKPAAQLDWIINAARNLSQAPRDEKSGLISIAPSDNAHDHTPLSLAIQEQRFVKLTSGAKIDQLVSSAKSRIPVTHSRQQAGDGRDQGDTIEARVYEVIDGQPRDKSISLGTNPSAKSEGIRRHQLGQLLESSTSQLSLPINEKFFRYLSSPVNQPGVQNRSTSNRKLDAAWAVRKPSNSSISLAKSFDTLKITCVARILNLKFSTSIKVRISSKPESHESDQTKRKLNVPHAMNNRISSGTGNFQALHTTLLLMVLVVHLYQFKSTYITL